MPRYPVGWPTRGRLTVRPEYTGRLYLLVEERRLGPVRNDEPDDRELDERELDDRKLDERELDERELDEREKLWDERELELRPLGGIAVPVLSMHQTCYRGFARIVVQTRRSVKEGASRAARERR